MSGEKVIKKGLALIMADFLGLVVGILNGFFLPMVFSVDGYAFFRTFTLYATYAVIFSFGLTDGMYLIYGGKKEKETSPSTTKAYYFFLLKTQAVVFLLLFLLSHYILKDDAFLFFSFFVIPLQIIHFFRLYYRALGEFRKYSIIQFALVFFELLNTLLIVFYVKSDQPHLFIIIKIINHALIALILSLVFLLTRKGEKVASLKRVDYLTLIKPGVVVLGADLVAVMIFSLDRWFVMFLFNKEDFAYYAFAVSILSLFLTFITSVTNIFYSEISKKLKDINYLKSLKNYALLLSSCFPLGYFIIEAVVLKFLPEYISSIKIFWILIMSLPFAGVVQIVYGNLYKAYRNVKLYITRMASILIISFLFNLAAYLIWGTLQATAVGTLLAFISWYLLSSKDFSIMGMDMSEVLYLMVLISGFVLIRIIHPGRVISSLLYLCLLGLNAFTFYRNDVIMLIRTFWFGVVRKVK